MSTSHNHKSLVRTRVWTELRTVAFPDSRFHHDYSSFIPDFEGSSAATDRLIALPQYQQAKIIFITPDNCLQELRLRALNEGKVVLVTTHGIRRGFWLLDPSVLTPASRGLASILDGMEKVGRHITLADSQTMGKIDMMVTGTGAINMEGLRFGKGHGFFDLEWGILFSLGVITESTPTAAIVHDCQVLDEKLNIELWDTGCDFVLTNTRTIEVPDGSKPSFGILWAKLENGMLEVIEPLRELQQMQAERLLRINRS